MVFLIHTELRCTVNHTSDLLFVYLFSHKSLSSYTLQFILISSLSLLPSYPNSFILFSLICLLYISFSSAYYSRTSPSFPYPPPCQLASFIHFPIHHPISTLLHIPLLFLSFFVHILTRTILQVLQIS